MKFPHLVITIWLCGLHVSHTSCFYRDCHRPVRTYSLDCSSIRNQALAYESSVWSGKSPLFSACAVSHKSFPFRWMNVTCATLTDVHY
jgi:hypothetical protein